MSKERNKNEKALLLAAVGFLLLTPPIMTLFNTGDSLLGIPILYLYSFLIWLFIISLAALLTRKFIQQNPHISQKRNGMGKERDL